jgi:hypothetical protein
MYHEVCVRMSGQRVNKRLLMSGGREAGSDAIFHLLCGHAVGCYG